ncbi:MAG: Eco57I restriction-modification methylase domain-containing protein, partial [Candidatus Hodarchaeota archaeon]
RILDPGCGSGTFPILAIKRAKDFARKHNISPGDTLKNILRNIYGFDLNPLAVISARTNYILAIADLLKYKQGEITIPIYLCDSINPPEARVADEMTLFPEKIPYEVKTTVGNFLFSHSNITRRRVQQLTNIIEDCVISGVIKRDFLKKVTTALSLTKEEYEESELYLEDTYDQLVKLNQRGVNGIWARIIKNAFAPLFVGRFDMVVGNPPWVNWESLPQEYRDRTAHLWQDYDLFSHKGLRARLGSAKDDISVLMTYVAIDKYLKDGGRLCFVITQTLFKTVGGGEGFRRFRLGKNGIPFKVLQVDDMVELQPFEEATNKTSVFLCKKGERTDYPVSYCLWRKKGKGTISTDLTFYEVNEKTIKIFLKAKSIDGSEQGPWVTAKLKALDATQKVIGESHYRAREGCSGALNSFYLVEVIEEGDDFLKIQNYTRNAKKKVKDIETLVEPSLFYPTLRGKEIQRWQAIPEMALLFCQNAVKPSRGIPFELLTKKFPKTYSYILEFEEELRNRSILKKYLQNEPFYAMFNSGPYSLAPYKVVWTRVGNDLKSAVVGKHSGNFLESKIVIPIETVVFIPAQEEDEANFVCAAINSRVTRFAVISYSNKATGSFGSPHILRNIAIPQFDSSNSMHRDLSLLSQQCHEKVAAGIDVTDLEEQIDELAADMWGLSGEELKDIKDSLEELR